MAVLRSRSGRRIGVFSQRISVSRGSEASNARQSPSPLCPLLAGNRRRPDCRARRGLPGLFPTDSGPHGATPRCFCRCRVVPFVRRPRANAQTRIRDIVAATTASNSRLGSEYMARYKMTSKDAALRAVGRTVVNFQRLEHYLKLVARLGAIEGTPAKIQKDIEKRRDRAATLTLGQAIQAWLNANDGEQPPASHTPDLFDATIRMTFSLGMDTERHSAHAATLRSLLETRNELIHGRLVKFEWDSPEECDRLLTQLDELNRSIAKQIEYIHSILNAFRSTWLEHVEMLQAAVAEEWPPIEQPDSSP